MAEIAPMRGCRKNRVPCRCCCDGARSVRQDRDDAARDIAEQATDISVEYDAQIRQRAQAASFGTDILAAGLTAVGLDDEGRIVRYEADVMT